MTDGRVAHSVKDRTQSSALKELPQPEGCSRLTHVQPKPRERSIGPAQGERTISSLQLKAPPDTYLITQLCRELGLTARTLRHYEEQSLLRPARRGSTRIYSREDRARLVLIKSYQSMGLRLTEIRRLLNLYDSEGESAQQASALTILKQQLEVMTARREEADQAISLLKIAIEATSGPRDEGGPP